MTSFPVAGPWITEKEISYATDAATNGWYETAGEYPARFERAFADRVDRVYAISLPSCTSGLHLALAALGIGPGDEVIVPELTWIATAAPISYLGADPVFADCDRQTWCLSADAFQHAITPRTKAVIVVDLYGSMPEMDTISRIAEANDIAVIEDAAEAIGSRYQGRPAGSFGLASTFSFHGSKTLTTGEGGMLVTNEEAFYARCMVLRDHGRAPGDVMFYNQELGYKYKMSALQAAVGLAQTERLDELVGRKRDIFAWYQEELANLSGVTLNAEPDQVFNSYWMATVILEPRLGMDKIALMEALRVKGIDCRPFFHPLSSIPAYANTPAAHGAEARNPAAYAIAPFGVNLPSALSLERDDIAIIAGHLRDIVRDARPSRA
ncbi:MAG: DegT/DnrJ/EryC1/StrS family aminotransferase [Rhodospirillaceae bacterium]|nr:DegT/DnrJ/EryC1/StrS family aminotransferase [Rhodospirillaceae bacterium]MBT3494500.1 DegT/DnrJ/EryC1/StrS family aminotransferase [Rhodospirillaceae bacterium]MBT3778842.1 DegT/DnrJ/EryC1/StrS family aminotransferase [Rhodospirillaceae bacterium]MBT3978639.1 DegT/DnrJ/EryC1/StrS family aminotransferase [Rhodospirillaceae bacterium]MBT4743159.1 DegT/DnrJ/EryC1/StrS family aminotransferase [Rhodospirillaceae bacterium]